MQQKTCSSDQDSDEPSQGTFTQTAPSRRRSIILRCLIVAALLVLLYAVSTHQFNSGPTLRNKLPTPVATPHPTPRRGPQVTPQPTLPINPGAANLAPSFSKLDIEKWVAQYINFVQEKEYWQAYKMLSPDIRARLSFAAFLADSNYILPKGCWDLGKASVSQKDSATWDEGVEMTNASCFDDRPIYYANWHFRVQWQDGQLAIVSIGLYPTAPAS